MRNAFRMEESNPIHQFNHYCEGEFSVNMGPSMHIMGQCMLAELHLDEDHWKEPVVVVRGRLLPIVSCYKFVVLILFGDSEFFLWRSSRDWFTGATWIIKADLAVIFWRVVAILLFFFVINFKKRLFIGFFWFFNHFEMTITRFLEKRTKNLSFVCHIFRKLGIFQPWSVILDDVWMREFAENFYLVQNSFEINWLVFFRFHQYFFYCVLFLFHNMKCWEHWSESSLSNW